MTTLLVVGLIVLLALNVPVAYAMLGISIVYLVFKQDIPMIVVAQQVAAGTDAFLLLAIPFFFLAAEFMSSGGVMQRLVDFASALVGHLRGGLAQMNVVVSILFSGVSGSAVADAAGPGRMEMEIMHRAGYPNGFSAAITAASATIGPIIPPSIPLVVYASIANVSVGRLFLAGFVPGVLMGAFLMVAVWWLAGRRNFPRSRWVGGRVLARRTVRSVPVLLLPVIILGGIFSGVFTPTESAIVAAGYALVIGVVLREQKLRDVPGLLVKVAEDTARVMLIVATAGLYSWILAREGVGNQITELFLDLGADRWVFLAVVNVLLLAARHVHGAASDHGRRRADPAPGGEGARHRPRPLRAGRDAQPDDRIDHAPGGAGDVRRHASHAAQPGGVRAGGLAVPARADRGAPGDHLLAGACHLRSELLLRVVKG